MRRRISRPARASAAFFFIALAPFAEVHAADAAPNVEIGNVVANYEAPHGCPSQAELESQVRRLRERPEQEPESRARVRIERAPSGSWEVRVELVSSAAGSRHERRLTNDRSCAELVRAAAVIIAIALNSKANEDAEELQEPQGDSAPPAPVPPQPSDSERSRASSRRSPLRGFGLRLAPIIDVGSLPVVGVGGAAVVAVRFRSLRIELNAAVFPPQAKRFEALPQAGADFWLWLGGSRFCAIPWTSQAWEVWGCGGMEAGQLRASAVGLEAAQSSTTPWLAVTAAGVLAYSPAAWVALTLEPGLSVPIRRTTFTVAEYGAFHRPSSLAFRGLLGLELRF